MIHNEMRKHGIKLVLGYTVEGFKGKDNGVEAVSYTHLDVYKRQAFKW